MDYDVSIHPRVFLESDIADMLAEGKIKALVFDVESNGDEELLYVEEKGLLLDNQISVLCEDAPDELIGVAEFNERVSGPPSLVYDRVSELLGSRTDFLKRFGDCKQIRVYIPEMFYLCGKSCDDNTESIEVTPFDLRNAS